MSDIERRLDPGPQQRDGWGSTMEQAFRKHGCWMIGEHDGAVSPVSFLCGKHREELQQREA